MADPIIRDLSSEDLPQISTFLAEEITKRGGSAGLLGEAFWRWKYLHPSAPMHASCVALDGERIVGFAGVIVRRMWTGTEEVSFAEIGDVYVEAAHRSKLLWPAMLRGLTERLTAAGVAFIFGRPNEKAAPTAFRLGYRELDRVQLWVRPLHADFLTERLSGSPLLARLLEVPLAAALRASLLPTDLGRLAPGLHLDELPVFDERLADLWRRARGGLGPCTVHDPRYLNWRYVESPRPYLRFGLSLGGRLLGVVVAVPGDPARGMRGEIADLFTAESAFPLAAYLLLGRALQALREEGCRMVRCYIPSGLREDSLAGAMRLHGFVRREDRDLCIVRAGAREDLVSRLTAEGHWRFRPGDTDYV